MKPSNTPNISITAIGDRGVDYSYARPTLDTQHKFVGRYLALRDASATYKKVISKAEVNELHKQGRGIFLIWEVTETRPLKGYGTGYEDGVISRQKASRLGYPVGMPIVAAVDFDVTPSTLTTVGKYLEGFKTGLASNEGSYTLGIYGDSDTLNAYGHQSWLNIRPNAKGWSPKDLVSATLHVQQYLPVRQDGSVSLKEGIMDPLVCVNPFFVWTDTPANTPTSMPRPRLTEYTIVKGDTLHGIVEKLYRYQEGTPKHSEMIDRIVKANKLVWYANGTRVRPFNPKQVLTVPAFKVL